MDRLLYSFSWLFCQVFLRPFIRVVELPQPLAVNLHQPCIFLIAKRYASDVLALKTCLKQLGIEQDDILVLPRPGGEKANQRFTEQLRQARHDNSEVQIVPVNVFWGRSPRKVKTVMQAWLADSWAVPGMIRRRLMVLTQMRQVACYFGQGMVVDYLVDGASEPDFHRNRHAMLTVQLRRQKEAVIGPDLSHRRMLAQQVLESETVQGCIEALVAAGEGREQKLNNRARKYLHEMAADYSYPVVRLFDLFLSWLWEKLYQGVELRGMENVLSVAEDSELIYVPCHRSHIDYLLLSYVVFRKGLMPPHIAAGINLNMPVLGSILRRGGAFFIRREFRDDKLYRAVLESYMATMCQQGVPIEYFIEGGRSRTGFLLPAKAGMLAMTMRVAQDQQSRPLAFIPVYFGYERLLESHSYISELYGEKKQKESLLDLFSARRYLREDYGKVYVSMGKAIRPDAIWRSLGVDESPRPTDGAPFFQCVERLGQSIQTEINNSASLSQLNLIATALLGSKRNALMADQLRLQLDLLQAMIDVPVYGESILLERCSSEHAIERALHLGVLQRNEHALGDIYYLDQRGQVSATFLRNNSLHVFVMPAVVASILINTDKAGMRLLQAVCYRLYPYLKAEYFLPWDDKQLVQVVEKIVSVLEAAGLLRIRNGYYRPCESETEEFHALMVLAGACKGSLERFYIAARLVTSEENGYYSRQSLEADCVKMAERLSLLHEFHAPDFFDKNLFRIFIASLIREGIFTEDAEGKLYYDDVFLKAKKLDWYALSPSVLRSIRHITRKVK